ncbi:MAG: four helix bundle protein [Chromatiaceae bacterium]|jgi:hypothetical protein|nr:four helix bundle protein [Chromatiaceae bacterium]
MRHLNHLPIWRDANRLLLAIEQAVRVFPRYHKYTLGSELRRQAMQVCRLIMRAGWGNWSWPSTTSSCRCSWPRNWRPFATLKNFRPSPNWRWRSASKAGGGVFFNAKYVRLVRGGK